MDKQIVFVGNPNVGKSAWINALSHADFKVGNWPGVTVEKKEALITWNHHSYHLIDLPGTYDIQDSVNEEAITARYLKEEHIDLIVNVVDASNLSRNLYLTLTLRELQIPMMIIFNFMDEVKKYQIDVDIERLQDILQLPIFPFSAFDRQGSKVVEKAIQQYAQAESIHEILLPKGKQVKFQQLSTYISQHLPLAIQLTKIEKKKLVLRSFYQEESTMRQLDAWDMDIWYIKSVSEQPCLQALDRYQFMEEAMPFLQDAKKRNQLTRKIDRIFLHRRFGMLILMVICTMLLMFIFNGSAPFTSFIDFLIHEMLMKYVYAFVSFLPDSAISLLINGILAGVGGVLMFVPLMAFLYFTLSFLEECGYMARIAFLLDSFMHHFHLSGKSFVSLLLGFGCNVPAIYATRTLDNEKQKRLTAMLIPFMSCGARLPVYMLFAAAFFKGKAAIMVISVYGIGMLLALVLALLFSRVEHFQDKSMMLLELPPYRKPSFQVLRKKVGQEVRAYVHKAMGIVLWAMIILWGLSYFPDGKVMDSYVAQFAKQVAPIYEPLGFGTRWESVAALPGSIIAKETVVGFLGQVLTGNEAQVFEPISFLEDSKRIAFEAGGTIKQCFQIFTLQPIKEPQDTSIVTAISTLWDDELASVRAYSYMVYILLSIPCIMTLQALYREYGYKLMCLSIATMFLVPYTVSYFIYQFFSFFY